MLIAIVFAPKGGCYHVTFGVKIHILDADVGESGQFPIPMHQIRKIGAIDAVFHTIGRPETDKHVTGLVGDHIADVMRLSHRVDVGAVPSGTAIQCEMKAFVAVIAGTPNQQGVVRNGVHPFHQTGGESR